MSEVLEAFELPSDGKPRYEVLIRRTSDSEFDILQARCVQGHMGEFLPATPQLPSITAQTPTIIKDHD